MLTHKEYVPWIKSGWNKDWVRVKKEAGVNVSLSQLVGLEDIDSVKSMGSNFPSLALVIVHKANMGPEEKTLLKSAISKALGSLGYLGGEVVNEGPLSGVKKSMHVAPYKQAFCHQYNPKHGGAFWGDQGAYEYVIKFEMDDLSHLKQVKQDYASFRYYLSHLLRQTKV